MQLKTAAALSNDRHLSKWQLINAHMQYNMVTHSRRKGNRAEHSH